MLGHGGSQEPEILMMPVEFYRQVGEAVRIRRRRGGALLNSKGEFNSSRIPRKLMLMRSKRG